MHQYADLTTLLADYLPDAKKASEQAAIGRILTSVSMFVDKFCRRPSGYFLGVEIPAETEESEPTLPAATIKRVFGEGERFLRLPVHVFGSIETLTLNDTAIDSETFYESDKNGWIYREENSFLPETSFDYLSKCRFYDGVIYKVSAVWGYRNTPADLSEAVRQTVERIWVTQRGFLGQITASGFIIERAMPEFAREVLSNYTRRQFEI